jgi:hypothetical protein
MPTFVGLFITIQANDEVQAAHDLAKQTNILPFGQQRAPAGTVLLDDSAAPVDGPCLARTVSERPDLVGEGFEDREGSHLVTRLIDQVRLIVYRNVIDRITHTYLSFLLE